MRRILMLVTVALVAVAMMAASTMPAFAVASEEANCLGQGSSTNAPFQRAGYGEGTAYAAQEMQGIGQEIAPIVTTNCYTR